MSMKYKYFSFENSKILVYKYILLGLVWWSKPLTPVLGRKKLGDPMVS